MSILQNLIIRFIGIMDLNSDRPHRPLNLVELTHSLLILLCFLDVPLFFPFICPSCQNQGFQLIVKFEIQAKNQASISTIRTHFAKKNNFGRSVISSSLGNKFEQTLQKIISTTSKACKVRYVCSPQSAISANIVRLQKGLGLFVGNPIQTCSLVSVSGSLVLLTVLYKVLTNVLS